MGCSQGVPLPPSPPVESNKILGRVEECLAGKALLLSTSRRGGESQRVKHSRKMFLPSILLHIENDATCKAHCLIGQRRKYLCSANTHLLTNVVLILTPSVLYASFALPRAKHDIANLIISPAITFLLTIITMKVAVHSNPGIISYEATEEERIQRTGFDGPLVDAPPDYCTLCCAVRPPRTHHCRRSGACIEKWDHWCIYLGRPIGRGNHRTFICFIISAAAHSYNVAINIGALLLADEVISFSLVDVFVACTDLVYCSTVAVLLTGFCMYHFFLITINQTTYEYHFKVAYADGKNPFDRGPVGNWIEFFTGR